MNRKLKLLGEHYSGHIAAWSQALGSLPDGKLQYHWPQHTFLRAGNGKTAQVRNITDYTDLVSFLGLGWGRENVAWTLHVIDNDAGGGCGAGTSGKSFGCQA